MYIYIKYIYICIRIRVFFSEMIQQRVIEYFQQLGRMGECFKLTHWAFWAKMLSKCKKIVYRLSHFGAQYKQILELEV